MAALIGSQQMQATHCVLGELAERNGHAHAQLCALWLQEALQTRACLQAAGDFEVECRSAGGAHFLMGASHALLTIVLSGTMEGYTY